MVHDVTYSVIICFQIIGTETLKTPCHSQNTREVMLMNKQYVLVTYTHLHNASDVV